METKNQKAALEYHPTLHPQLVLWISRWGSKDEEIAAALGMTVAELAGWKKEHPEIVQAIAEGRKYWLELAETSLQKLVKGYDWDETEIVLGKDEQGRQKQPSIKRTTRHVPPNQSALMFFLKNNAAFRLAQRIAKQLPEGMPPSALDNLFNGSDVPRKGS